MTRLSETHEVFQLDIAPEFTFRWWPSKSHLVWCYGPNEDGVDSIVGITVPGAGQGYRLSESPLGPVVRFDTYGPDDATDAARRHVGRVMARRKVIARWKRRTEVEATVRLVVNMTGRDRQEIASMLDALLETPGIQSTAFPETLDAAKSSLVQILL